jgi:hypothetical protein
MYFFNLYKGRLVEALVVENIRYQRYTHVILFSFYITHCLILTIINDGSDLHNRNQAIRENC